MKLVGYQKHIAIVLISASAASTPVLRAATTTACNHKLAIINTVDDCPTEGALCANHSYSKPVFCKKQST